MALPRGLINARKFVTYNRDEVTRAERQPLETRSDGLGAYLTPQQVGAVVLFLVENLTAPCRLSLRLIMPMRGRLARLGRLDARWMTSSGPKPW